MMAAASWPSSDSTSLVTLPSGPGPAADDGAVGAAHVEDRHGLVPRDEAADPAGAARQALGVGVEGRDAPTSAGIVMPPWPPPMDTLSLPSVARATVQPPLTGPTTSSSGTKTSLKKTSLNSDWPVTMRSGRTSTPSACMSMTMVVMPWCLGTSGSVRMVASPKLASARRSSTPSGR